MKTKIGREKMGSNLKTFTIRLIARSHQSTNEDVDFGMKRYLVARRELRQGLNEATLRAFRNADRFTTFKIFRGPGAL
jgi:hypothetical protein